MSVFCLCATFGNVSVMNMESSMAFVCSITGPVLKRNKTLSKFAMKPSAKRTNTSLYQTLDCCCC